MYQAKPLYELLFLTAGRILIIYIINNVVSRFVINNL
jgi:hypothetical protein